MTRVRLSEQARTFIQREAKYLRERNRVSAEHFLDRIREARINLARFPEIGRTGAVPLPGLRRLVVGTMSSITCLSQPW